MAWLHVEPVDMISVTQSAVNDMASQAHNSCCACAPLAQFV